MNSFDCKSDASGDSFFSTTEPGTSSAEDVPRLVFSRSDKEPKSIRFARTGTVVHHGILDHDGLIRLRRQIEWYFSDANLITDRRLREQISDEEDEVGWVRASHLLHRRRIRELNATSAMLAEALRKSHLETWVEPAPEWRLFVRRRQPLPPLLPEAFRSVTGELPAEAEWRVLADDFQTMNRLTDQQRVQRKLGLSEVGDSHTVFRERLPWDVVGTTAAGPVLAVGYERVLYGDHGPYIEFSAEQIRWYSWPHYYDKRHYRAYYDEYYTLASYRVWEERWAKWTPSKKLFEGLLMLYAQRHSVADRPWAPGASSNPHCVERPGGYADYRPGYFYVAADANLISAAAHM